MEDRLYKKLEAYGKSDFYPFHMPGHKRNPLAVDGDFPVERDITEIDGFDNLHHPEGILRDSMDWAAALYGADQTYYLINGSTSGFMVCRRVFTVLMEAPGRSWRRCLRLWIRGDRSWWQGTAIRRFTMRFICGS